MTSDSRNEKTMPPLQSLPLHPSWPDEGSYVQSLLSFATESDLFRNLCGGLHILDFLTREPVLYDTVVPAEWRTWFDQVDIHAILRLLLHEDLDPLLSNRNQETWNHAPFPPDSLLEYISTVRRHCLVRTQVPTSTGPGPQPIPRRLAGGMKPKKAHEVQHFSAYVHRLSLFVAEETGEPVLGFVDFGSGQNYLGRTLAASPYFRDVIAIERRHHNVAGAKRKDVNAKLAVKESIMRNKKEYKRHLMQEASHDGSPIAASSINTAGSGTDNIVTKGSKEVDLAGSITYIEQDIRNGQIEDIIYPPDRTSTFSSATSFTSAESLNPKPSSSLAHLAIRRPNLMVLSLHSCGNLSHHGLRTLKPSLNPSVSAVALVGCCYNLLTERLGPLTYKHPILRSHHPRLEATGSAYDPHGFPMSKKLEDFPHRDGSRGIRLNITARMMAVQAPYNWGRDDSEAFFTRHFYRALLQKMLTDAGVVKSATEPDFHSIGEGSVSDRDGYGTPPIIGSLRKSAFTSFPSYVDAALEKLGHDAKMGRLIRSKAIFFTDDVIRSYEAEFSYARKQLAVTWALMAFSAGVVESIIVVDRWLWLKEQVGWVGKCWVEAVFDYKWSPRNLVVVGIRKRQKGHDSKEKSRPGKSESNEEGSGPTQSV